MILDQQFVLSQFKLYIFSNVISNVTKDASLCGTKLVFLLPMTFSFTKNIQFHFCQDNRESCEPQAIVSPISENFPSSPESIRASYLKKKYFLRDQLLSQGPGRAMETTRH